jgi:hypothetical protein
VARKRPTGTAPASVVNPTTPQADAAIDSAEMARPEPQPALREPEVVCRALAGQPMTIGVHRCHVDAIGVVTRDDGEPFDEATLAKFRRLRGYTVEE